MDGPALDHRDPIALSGIPIRHVLVGTRILQRLDGEPLLLGLLHDITDFVKMQDALRRRESLAKTGEMICAINHELKNIMQPVLFQLRLVGRMPIGDPDLSRAFEIVTDRTHALERLVSSLRDFARPIQFRLQVVDVAALVQSAWLDAKRQSNIDFALTKAQPDLSWRCDGYWMRLVLVNLFRNAIEALQGVATPCVTVTCEQSEKLLTIVIEDNGCGMDDATQQRVFEPFFTTKAEAGTGLGLSISRRVVEAHGGILVVRSAPGKGTAFTLTLGQMLAGSTELLIGEQSAQSHSPELRPK